MSFPPRPANGQDPWYAARETYDNAIEDYVLRSLRRRGVLPDGTDLDDLDSLEDAGIWSLSGSFTYYNVPVNNQSRAVLEIIHSAHSAGIVQRFTVGGAPDVSTVGVYWRESGTTSADQRFWPWYELASIGTGGIGPRGFLPDGTDLDDLIGRSDSGIWTLSGNLTYYNRPVENRTSVVLEVMVGGGNAPSVLQRVTVGGLLGIDTAGVYWRELIGTASEPYFPPWRKNVSSVDILNIRTTNDPTEQASENELLIVLEP